MGLPHTFIPMSPNNNNYVRYVYSPVTYGGRDECSRLQSNVLVELGVKPMSTPAHCQTILDMES